MDSITREGCKLVLNEVYEGDLQGFIARSDAFFAVMPKSDVENELSEFSPLYDAGDQEQQDGDGFAKSDFERKQEAIV